jgi:hypothetical protein
MAMKKKGRPKPTHAEIVRCAYLIYESRSREHGRDLEDWLEAEMQLSADRNQEVETDQQKKSVMKGQYHGKMCNLRK